jgi:type IV fimbrial biogenesis protein FimT
MNGKLWEDGWVIQSGGCIGKQASSKCRPKNWLSQGNIEPVYFKGGGRQFLTRILARGGFCLTLPVLPRLEKLGL